MGFWGIEVQPGKPYTYQSDDVEGKVYITQATLGHGSSSERCILQCSVRNESPVYLCSLLPNKVECCSLDLEFEEDDNVVFSVVGSRSVHLTGNFIVDDGDFGDECCDDSDCSGEDIAGTDTDDSIEFTDEEESDDVDMLPSSHAHNSGVVIEEIVDDDKPTQGNDQSKRPKKKKKNQLGNNEEKKNSLGQNVAKGSSGVPVIEDEDGFPISSSHKTEVDTEKPDTTIEQTPKSTVDKTKSKKAKKAEERSAAAKRKAENSDQDGQPESKNLSEEKNKKKKKTREGEDLTSKEKTVSAVGDKGVSAKKIEKQTEAKSSKPRTFDNGLAIEELALGKPNGKRASPGSQVSVHYIGKLQKNGKIFDSNVGRRPFKFRLGVGEVIKGWDVGVNGMRVGDKRRLTIPPALGIIQSLGKDQKWVARTRSGRKRSLEPYNYAHVYIVWPLNLYILGVCTARCAVIGIQVVWLRCI